MTFRDALDAVHALLVDELMRMGKDLLSTLDERQEWAAGGKRIVATAGGTLPSPQVQPADNDASLAQIMRVLKGSDFKGTR